MGLECAKNGGFWSASEFPTMQRIIRNITVRGARQHNLKDIDVEIPRNKLTVITGLSGSGKSSLAFDTIYAEGQRRYVESLSAYARQFLDRLEPPDVDSIEGLSPAISIEQKTAIAQPAIHGRNRHRNLRLSPASVFFDRCSALLSMRQADLETDSGSDRPPSEDAARRRARDDPRADRARPKRGVQEAASGARKKRVTCAAASTASFTISTNRSSWTRRRIIRSRSSSIGC